MVDKNPLCRGFGVPFWVGVFCKEEKIQWVALNDLWLGLTSRNRVSVPELAMNLKVTSRNPVSPQLCVSPDDVSSLPAFRNSRDGGKFSPFKQLLKCAIALAQSNHAGDRCSSDNSRDGQSSGQCFQITRRFQSSRFLAVSSLWRPNRRSPPPCP